MDEDREELIWDFGYSDTTPRMQPEESVSKYPGKRRLPFLGRLVGRLTVAIAMAWALSDFSQALEVTIPQDVRVMIGLGLALFVLFGGG